MREVPVRDAREVVLGLDLGTSSLKLIYVDRRGQLVAAATEGYAFHTPHPGFVEQRPADWIGALIRGMERLHGAVPDASIVNIGITGQMHGTVLLSADGEPLQDAILWLDQRGETELAEACEQFSLDVWMSETGSRPNVSFMLVKLLWLRRHRSDVWSRVRKALLPKDYLRFWLTGELVTDSSDASGTLMYSQRNHSWSQQILDAFHIDCSMLPDIRPAATVSGYVQSDAAHALGVPAGIPVVCGVGDAIGQTVGNGIVRPDVWMCNIGTSGQIMSPPMHDYRYDGAGRVHTLAHAAAGQWSLMGATLSAGLSLQWYAQNVRGLSEDDYPALLQQAKQSPPGARGLLFLPYLSGERTPHMDHRAKGAFVGLTVQHMEADLIRAILEGVLFSLRQSLDLATSFHTTPPQRICLSGGAAESPIWRQLVADVFGLPVSWYGVRSGAAYGAAMIAAIASGWFPSLVAAADGWLRELDTAMPDAQAHAELSASYEIYTELYPQLQNSFWRLDALGGGPH